jgi:hypothetical protein
MSNDRALDDLYRRINDKLCAGDFSGVDTELGLVDIEQVNTVMLLGWLTITLEAKDKLTMRKNFAADVRKKLERIDYKRVNAQLSGLE